MKHLCKRVCGILLTLAMLLTMAPAAFAEEELPPVQPATRSMIAQTLWIASGKPVVNYAMSFADVPQDSLAADAIRWAASEGIVKGYDSQTFGPDDLATREQFAVMLYRLAQSKGLGFTGMWSFPLNHPDAAQVSDWADEAVHWVVMQNAQYAAEKLDPKGTVSKMEVILVLASYMMGAGVEADAFKTIQLGTSPFTLCIPEHYTAGALLEEEIADDMVGYYSGEDTEVDFDVYQYSKEGLTQGLVDYTAEEAKLYNAFNTMFLQINGIPVAAYFAKEVYEGTEYVTLTCLFDAEDQRVELVFWLDEANAQTVDDTNVLTLATIICTLQQTDAQEGSLRTLKLGTSPFSVQIPDGYMEGVMTEEDVADDQVGYYKHSDDSKVDFDVYQFSKEGEPEDLTAYAEKEAQEFGSVPSVTKINLIPVAWYGAVETYEGQEYTTLTAIFDTDSEYVEIVFWLSTEANLKEAEAILSTLQKAQ